MSESKSLMASFGSALGVGKKKQGEGEGEGEGGKEGILGSLGSLLGSSKKGDGGKDDEGKGKEEGKGVLGSLGSLLGSSKKGDGGKDDEGKGKEEGKGVLGSLGSLLGSSKKQEEGEGKEKEEGKSVLGSLGSLLGSSKKKGKDDDAEGGLDSAGLNGALAALESGKNHDPDSSLIKDSFGLTKSSVATAYEVSKSALKTGWALTKATVSEQAREEVKELLTSVEDISQGKTSGSQYVDVGLKVWDSASRMIGDVKDQMFDFAIGVVTQLMCNNRVEEAIGVILFFAMYLFGWIRGFAQSSGSCDSAGTCRPEYVLFSMIIALVEVWMYVVVGVMLLVVVDKLFIATLFMSRDGWSIPDASVTIGVRIAFSWILNSRLLIALGVAWGLTFAFAFVYLKWIQLRGSKGEERRLAVRNVYMFNLGMVLMVLVLQMWIDWWWKKG
jgi:hypothetical protein